MRPIDADAVIKNLSDISTGKDRFGRGIKAGISTAILRLENAPTITLDDLRPRGRWIGKNSPYDVNIHICSVCREQVSILGNKLRYCPNCGAKMDLEE